jgi:Ser/Thr protein kinase RdoA (MazF antagonist)
MGIDLQKALYERWGCRIGAVGLVEEEEGRQCCRVESDRGPLFVKVYEDREGVLDDVLQGLEAQVYAGGQGIPTVLPLLTTDGGLYARLQGYGVVVAPWVERREVERDPSTWREFGRIVGRLHALDAPDKLKNRPARMEPRRTLEAVRGQVRQRRDQVPGEYQARLDAFSKTAGRLDDFPSAPRCLIHTDLAWGNLLQTADGCLLLVDFEGAGVGPAVVDLVEVTTYLCRGPSASGPLQADAARAFYEGYAEHRRLTADEIDLFPQAHFYHQFYYLANSLGRGDYDFIRRMQARLDNWNGGVLDQLAEIEKS